MEWKVRFGVFECSCCVLSPELGLFIDLVVDYLQYPYRLMAVSPPRFFQKASFEPLFYQTLKMLPEGAIIRERTLSWAAHYALQQQDDVCIRAYYFIAV